MTRTKKTLSKAQTEEKKHPDSNETASTQPIQSAQVTKTVKNAELSYKKSSSAFFEKNESLVNALEWANLNPLRELAVLANETENPQLRAKILMWFGDKLVPDVKSIDIQEHSKKDIEIRVLGFTQPMQTFQSANDSSYSPESHSTFSSIPSSISLNVFHTESPSSSHQLENVIDSSSS